MAFYGNLLWICSFLQPHATSSPLRSKYSLQCPKLHVCCTNLTLNVNPLNPRDHYMYRTVVTICTAQWSLYVPPVVTMVTICTAQRSLYVPHSGHYLYRQWSLYVPHSGHYMYCTVVTICTAQWSLYIPPV